MASLQASACFATETFYGSEVVVPRLFGPMDFTLASPSARFPAIWNAPDLSPQLYVLAPFPGLFLFFLFKNNLHWKAEVNINFSGKHSRECKGEESLVFLFWTFRKSYREVAITNLSLLRNM